MLRTALLAALITSPAPDSGPGLARCLASVRHSARAAGITTPVWDAATAGFSPDSSVLLADRHQPEFALSTEDYLAAVVDSQRIAEGRDRLAVWDTVLAAIEARTGVDRHVVVAIWGVESDYGRVMGRRPLVRSLLTGACQGRRRRFFREQLIAALRIVQRGDIPLDRLVGSWAGAFGQTQFLPTTFLAKAVDGDGDGHRDLIASVPDALWSAAEFLRRAGWVAGSPWGYEVRIPSGYRGPAGRRKARTLDHWATAGVVRLDSLPLAGSERATLLSPAGVDGPRFLALANYRAIFGYNAADSYTLAIAHLADRLAGRGTFRTPWPGDDRGVSRIERREIKERLATLGYDAGPPDGSITERMRAAIRMYEDKAGLPVTGRPGGRLLDRLRSTGPWPSPPAPDSFRIRCRNL